MRTRLRMLVGLIVAALATPAVLVGTAGSGAAQAVNFPPVANHDVIAFTTGQDFTLDVLANDTDPNLDPLQIVSATIVTPYGSTVRPSTSGPSLLEYTPGTIIGRYDHLVYTIEDGQGGTDTGLVTIAVDSPLPPRSPIVVSPARLDFGTVPAGKTATREVTVTNVSPNPVGPFTFWEGAQRAPQPFETNTFRSGCFVVLQSGDSCTHTLRFWSVPGATAAAPAALEIFANQSNVDLLEAVPMFAATAPAVAPPPNAPPVAPDDLASVFQPSDQLVDPTRNDDDADNDQLQIVGAGNPPHGSVAVESCAGIGAGRSPHASCLRYTPDAGFVGVDFVDYTVSDGRGGTDTGTIWLGVQSGLQFPIPRIDSVTPDHGPPGADVTIIGDNFTPGHVGGFVRWRCGARQETSHAFSTVHDPFRHQILVQVPDLPPGPCDVEVGNGFNFTGVLANGYTVDTPAPAVLPGGASIVEGDSGTKTMNLPVRLSAPPTQPVTVQWTTLPLTGSRVADGATDYTPASGQVTFAAGDDTVKTVPIAVNGDRVDEPDEYVWVSWHSPTNATIGGFNGLGYGVIKDNDPPPKVLPGVATVVEGNAGTTEINVPVSLSAASGKTVTVEWTTLLHPGSGFADAVTDYTPASGVVTFEPTETTKTARVVVHGDTLDEPDEYIVVSFRNSTNATMGGYWGLGFGVIQDDD